VPELENLSRSVRRPAEAPRENRYVFRFGDFACNASHPNGRTDAGPRVAVYAGQQFAGSRGNCDHTGIGAPQSASLSSFGINSSTGALTPLGVTTLPTPPVPGQVSVAFH